MRLEQLKTIAEKEHKEVIHNLPSEPSDFSFRE